MADNEEVVIVTGGANGIGRVYSRALAIKGYRSGRPRRDRFEMRSWKAAVGLRV